MFKRVLLGYDGSAAGGFCWSAAQRVSLAEINAAQTSGTVRI